MVTATDSFSELETEASGDTDGLVGELPEATLDELFDRAAEWLMIGEDGRTLPLGRDEIEVERLSSLTRLHMISDRGRRSRTVDGFMAEGGEIHLQLADRFGSQVETVRFVPRVSAAELAANVVLARLERANHIAAAFCDLRAAEGIELSIKRVGLSSGAGRFGEIICNARDGRTFALLSDLTATVPPEAILTAAISWHDRMRARNKKPPRAITIAAPKKTAGELQKLCALLREGRRNDIEIAELKDTAAGEVPQLRPCSSFGLARLWRFKPRKLVLPDEIVPRDTAAAIAALAPDSIDVIHSRHGETLRFLGLPFARVRTVGENEAAWFGVGKHRRPLTAANWRDLEELVTELAAYRRPDPPSKRHSFYLDSPESWLESILRRNVRLLDANLILAPIYNQFRTAADKIDLLAMRRDGRLVVIEIKASPDRETPFQAADYWRKIELLRRRGELQRARVFGDLQIAERPALVYAVAPALSFHRDFDKYASMLVPEIELWRFELHEHWRKAIKVIARKEQTF